MLQVSLLYLVINLLWHEAQGIAEFPAQFTQQSLLHSPLANARVEIPIPPLNSYEAVVNRVKLSDFKFDKNGRMEVHKIPPTTVGSPSGKGAQMITDHEALEVDLPHHGSWMGIGPEVFPATAPPLSHERALDRIAVEAFSEEHKLGAHFITANEALFNEMFEYMIVPMSADNQKYWTQLGMQWHSLPEGERAGVRTLLQSHSDVGRSREAKEYFEVLDFNFLRGNKGLPAWWSQAQVDSWIDSGLDWRSTATLGDLLGFGRETKLKKSWIVKRFKPFSELLQDAKWTTKKVFVLYRMISKLANPLAQSAEIQILRGFKLAGKSVFDERMNDFIRSLSSRIETLEKMGSSITPKDKANFESYKQAVVNAQKLVLPSPLAIP